MKLVTAEEMRQLEAAAEVSGTSVATLMERAGKGVAQAVRAHWKGVAGRRLVVLVGPGNNGGDGLVAAHYLKQWGAEVCLYLCQHRDDANFRGALQQDIPWTVAERDKGLAFLDSLLASAHGVIDALFGTGRLRPLSGWCREVLLKVGKAKEARPQLCLFALDLPSGLDSDSGAVDPATLKADVTITLGYPKRGLFAFPGRERAGELRIVDIGLPPAIDIPTELLTPGWLRTVLPPRPSHAHKGSFGRVLVIAGSTNYVGAAYLACQGAARVGAGLVTLATARSLHPTLAAKLTEVTHIPLPEAEPGVISPQAVADLEPWLPQYQVLLVGPGLGQRPETADFLRALLAAAQRKPLVLDADGLNLLAKEEGWWRRLSEDTILTPHPAEMARLCRLTLEEVQSDRLELARRQAQAWQKVVVLKGAHSVIASPLGRLRLCPVAHPALASAGTGDVLAGAIAGFLAQGLSPFDAAAAGVYVHGLAGERLGEEKGKAGILASDLLPWLPRLTQEAEAGALLSPMRMVESY